MKLTGKQRAARIDRRYYLGVDPYVRVKRLAGLGGLAVGIVYSCWVLTGFGSPQISSGDLSHAHSAWNEHGCENCHLPNVPIRPDAWGGSSIKNVALNNNQCNSKCHAVSDHFADRTIPDVMASESCSECHREHLGKDFQLTNLADQSCNRCHRDIERSALASDQNRIRPAYNFSDNDGHPEFRSIKSEDPGTIKFSHIQHLRLGQPKTIGDETAKKLQDLEAIFQERYSHGQAIQLDRLIQLNCDDCHEPDIADFGSGLGAITSRAKGNQAKQSNNHRLYKPVNFEKHCIACHNLDGIPHGLNREQTQAAVKKLIPANQLEFLTKKNQLGPELSFNEAIKQELGERETRLTQLLNDETQCKKCHILAAADSSQIVAPSQVPERWFKQAVFAHGAHSMVACKDCHPQPFAEADSKIDSGIESNQVMIAGIESCRKCHIQNDEKRAKQFVAGTAHVATADCIDCHRYHVDPPREKRLNAFIESAGFDLEKVRTFLSQGVQR